ncbi:MAG: hypothetical protein KF900_05455 [Bacteroidetes bacterium]|nr:hypothetical protein [Bacteroidota bacterium]
MMKKNLLFLTFPLLVFVSCNNNSLEVDISNVNTEPLKILRLDNDLFTLNEKNFDKQSEIIKHKYGIYYEHYLAYFLNRGGTKDTLYKPSVLDFVNDKDVRETYAYVKKLYPDTKIESINNQLNNCVKRFHYHFPEKKLPKNLITCLRGWNYAFSYMDSSFVLGLDMYMGDTAKFYQMLRFPKYMTKNMNEHYIVPDIMRGWLLTEFDNDVAENILLNHTIFYGKLYYAINALLPNAHDSLLIGYTGKQLKYCRDFEKQLWSYFAEKNRLYENNLQTIRELTSEGPFTGAISKDCPPRIAMWVGWQIVKSYMKHNKDISLGELMKEKDSKKILSKSKYRP